MGWNYNEARLSRPFRHAASAISIKKVLADPDLPSFRRRSLGDQVGSWNLEFAGDIGLTQTTGRRRVRQPVFLPFLLEGFRIDIFFALIFVMAFFRNGAGRASRNAFSTFFVSKLETIFSVVSIFLFTRGQFEQGDGTAESNGNSLGSDEPVIEAEGPETAGVSDMAFRPGRSPAHLLIPKILKRREEARRHGKVP